jgi:hypothetical protein
MNLPAPDLRPLLRTGLARSLVSLFIKVATAGLTYAMYVVLSRTMGATEYGYFAFGLSLATVLAIAASMGQQTAILRYWPEEEVAGRHAGAVAALRSGGALTILAALVIALALGAGAGLLGLFAGQPVAPRARSGRRSARATCCGGCLHRSRPWCSSRLGSRSPDGRRYYSWRFSSP